MPETPLPGLIGTNPLGFLAALGALDVAHRSGLTAALRWTDDIEPVAMLTGLPDVGALAALVEADRQTWVDSPVLTWATDGTPPPDLKVRQADLRLWIGATLDSDKRCHADLMSALVAEGAVAGKGESKPTHLHFTAGQQKFLVMVRTLATAVAPADVQLALTGPWSRSSPLPVLGWDVGQERAYAFRGSDPGPEKKLGTPGADWLAFLGLTYFPVANDCERLVTTGCSLEWKRGWFRWPLWTRSLSSDVVRSVLGDRSLWRLDSTGLVLRGVSRILEAPVRRSEQGGYGSFGSPSDVLVDVNTTASPGSRRRRTRPVVGVGRRT